MLACALTAAPVAAQPASGPRETVDQSFTTTAPGAATGLAFSAAYHAAGDPQGNPPYLRRMVFQSPPGMRYDTSVPDRCTATDAQLAVMGPDACPAGSRIGTGTTDGIFYFPFSGDQVVDRFHHTLHVLNGDHEQILLVESEGYTVVRGRFTSDGSLEFDPPSCFPAPPAGGCADDYILQLKSATTIPAITRAGRAYATTPPSCPSTGEWETTLRYWWSDGSTDAVVTRQPCGS